MIKFCLPQYVLQGFCLAIAGLFVTGAAVTYPAPQKAIFTLPKEVPAPADNQLTPPRIQLGKMLFFDPRLSGSDVISCATCHNPSLDWADAAPLARGEGLQILPRATPSIINVGFNAFQMWDGRFTSLEEQAWTPMLAAAEMHGLQEAVVLAKLKGMPGYVNAFEKAYPGEGITRNTVAKALASFERTIVSGDAPFDEWVQGDESAVSLSAKRGFQLFTGKANCIACHQGSTFRDQGFHNIGLKGVTDPGRYAIVRIPILRGAFKTPTLRDVARTGPYMHNGAYQTLEQVIDHYDRGGDDKENLDPNMKPLGLTIEEKEDLVEFLKTLSGKQQAVTLPQLPQQQ
ncbi:MAG TPA: cytochrome c peroxidase [Candidatus Acidoferrum sp.]|jgi:cytochrome c peroxidase